MNNEPNNTIKRRRTITARVAVIATTVAVIGGTAAGARNTPPPWTHCAFADHPPAADLVPLLPVNAVPTAETLAVILGEARVGTDCSIYDLPV